MSHRFRLVAGLILIASGARAQGANRVFIGATLPLSGPDARPAEAYKLGYELAVEDVNRSGGVHVGAARRQVALWVRDDGGDPAKAASLLEELVVKDHADALLGSYGTPLIEAQAAVATSLHLPLVNAGTSAGEVYERFPQFLFGVLSPVKMLAFAEIAWLEEQQRAGRLPHPLRIALVWEDTAHGRDFRKGMLSLVERPGAAGRAQVVIDESFPLNSRDFRPLLGRVKAANADAVLADAHLPDFISMHAQYLEAGLCHRVLSYGPRGAEKAAAATLGKEAVEGLLSAVWWSADLPSDRSAQFVARFSARFRRAPEWYEVASYETARALLTAIDTADSVAPEDVRRALEGLHMESMLPGGQLNFPAAFNHQAHYPFVVIQNGANGLPGIVHPAYLARSPGAPRSCDNRRAKATPAASGSIAVRP